MPAKKTTAKATKKVIKDSIEKTEKDDSLDDDKVYVTKDGLKSLKEELTLLKTVKRKEVSARLKEAISFGDLSENSEYEEAKNEQAFIEGRILDLESKIKNVKIISGKHSTVSITLGSKIKVKNLNDKSEFEFTIVGTTESSPLDKLISNESPIGSVLIDKVVGDIVDVDAPSGLIKYEVISFK